MCYNNYHLLQSFINDAMFLCSGPWWSPSTLKLQHCSTPTHVPISTSRFYYTYIGLVHHNFHTYKEKAYKCIVTSKKRKIWSCATTIVIFCNLPSTMLSSLVLDLNGPTETLILWHLIGNVTKPIFPSLGPQWFNLHLSHPSHRFLW